MIYFKKLDEKFQGLSSVGFLNHIVVIIYIGDIKNEKSAFDVQNISHDKITIT